MRGRRPRRSPSDTWTKPKTEAELCARFAARATAAGFTVYPETGGFDQLLVAADGTQIGVEAKLRGTFHVLMQAYPTLWCDDEVETKVGPDYRAVLVPEEPLCFNGVALAMGLFSWELRRLEEEGPYGRRPLDVAVPADARLWPSLRRITLPDFVPTTEAGAPSPRQMTRWLQGAIKLCAHLREKGHVTIYDFRAYGLHPQLWIDRWLTWQGETTTNGHGRAVRMYRQREGVRMPDAGTGAPGAEP
jgi:hypothetical protein